MFSLFVFSFGVSLRSSLGFHGPSRRLSVPLFSPPLPCVTDSDSLSFRGEVAFGEALRRIEGSNVVVLLVRGGTFLVDPTSTNGVESV